MQNRMIWCAFYPALPACLLMSSLGCSGNVDMRTGAIEDDPQAAVEEVFRLYDANSDGAIDAEEINKSPSLASAKTRIDTDGDGRLTAEELTARFEKYKVISTHVSTTIAVTRKGQPLPNAEVTFEPEPFLGDDVPTYQGTTNEIGMASLTSTPPTPGFVVGFYTVRVKQSDGKEAVKGFEITDDTGFEREIRFDVGT